MDNIKFSYLYRDSGNYKKWAEVIFSNPDGLPLEAVTKALEDAFLPDGLFIAHQIRIPEAFLFDQGDASSDDHCFHELDSVESTVEAPTDGHSRSISRFLAEVNKEAKRGWLTFDPHDRLPQKISD